MIRPLSLSFDKKETGFKVESSRTKKDVPKSRLRVQLN